MARNLRAKTPDNDEILVYDVNATATQSFLQESQGTRVQAAVSPREVAEMSDTVITVLPEPQHVKSVFEKMLASALPAPPTTTSRLFLDCSTIDPTTSRLVASLVHASTSESSAIFVDAPMSGGVVGARAGSLTFMVGCEPDMLSKVEKVLLLMGKKVWHLGAQGAGLSGKLANNYALAINNIAAAEAMNLGLKWGLDPKTLGNLINSSTGRSWPSEVNNPVPGVVGSAPASRDYEGGFGVSLMKKDLKLAIRAAQEADARLELATKAEEVYEKVEQDYMGKDFSVVYRWLGGKE
ncbi:hypothetical protein EPUS_02743 [Endocarpon pusillum Z07020]|uniref:3-hydroxyisobutyrate dehydrogenase n=1 Tax=Endocarpon pusillum (strain Z07020 / HMAS-L-300199) TaxID=1263415 RepID=U1FU37_ENDPU|nr:uncharacterized protein EPUS_02743 [Endocarpon pusillum Z07020]ERF68287.1 hypothetical protein EPUS_02743 [Endocarpon pusillum Z07020]